MSSSDSNMVKESANLKMLLSLRKKNTQTARKFIIVMAVPVIGLLFMSAEELANALNTNRDVDRTKVTLGETVLLVNLIVSLQNEKGMAVIYVSSPEKDALHRLDKVQLETDTIFMKFKEEYQDVYFEFRVADTQVTVDNFVNVVHQYRLEIYRRGVTFKEIILFYSALNNNLMNVMVKDIDLSDSENIWRKYVSFTNLLPASDALGIQRAIGSQCFTSCVATNEDIIWLVKLQGEIKAHIVTATEYNLDLKANYQKKRTEMNSTFSHVDNMKHQITSQNIKSVCGNSTEKERKELSMEWYNKNSDCINVLLDFISEGVEEVLNSLEFIVDESRAELAGYSVFMVVAMGGCLILCVLYVSSINKLTLSITQYAENTAEKNQILAEEKKRTELLLYQLLPKSVADQLKISQEVRPEYFSSVTIYFSDIVGFTAISAACSPHQIIDLLNRLYRTFDFILEQYDVYKVETIGDAYMVVSGLPRRNGVKHVTEIASMSLRLLKSLEDFSCPYTKNQRLELRIGLHSGAVAAGVVGTKMPRYCLFGDTVNIAQSMESTGEALKIHISDATHQLLSKIGGFRTEKRENIEVKGKRLMTTFWLQGYEGD